METWKIFDKDKSNWKGEGRSELDCSLEYYTRVASNHFDVNSINSSSSESNLQSGNAQACRCKIIKTTKSIL